MVTPSPNRGFTLIELLVVITIIVVLLALLLPSLNKAIDVAHGAVCLSNLRQQRIAMGAYLFDTRGVFPDHRTDYTAGSETDRYWATTLLRYGTTKELYRDPAIGSETDAYGRNWTWAFTQDWIGYGYNGFFLGVRLYPDQTYGGITSTGYFRLANVRSPAVNMCIADTNKAVWGQSIWWPSSGSNVNSWESVGDNRHAPGASVVFNDGHAEFIKSSVVSAVGDAGWDHSTLKYWDPLQRP